jgi:hypothetical protein
MLSSEGANLMLDFPSSPTNGQTFTAGGVVWQWDNTKWVPASTSGSAFLTDPPSDGQAYSREAGLWVQHAGFNSGFVNKLRNGTFDVWQRGTSGTAASGAYTYTVDGWFVGTGGAAVTWAQAAWNLNTLWALSVTGAAGNTATSVNQRIESAIAVALGGALPVTFQAKIYNNTGAALTPTLTVSHASAVDNFASVITDLAATNLQSCANGVTTRVAYTFTVPTASAQLGLQVTLSFGALVAGKTFFVAETDLRATPGLLVGLNANPPPPELRPISEELVFCQRYFQTRRGSQEGVGTVIAGAQAYTVGAIFGFMPYLVQMRVAPTVTISAAGDFQPTNSVGATAAAFTTASFAANKFVGAAFNFSGSSGLTAGNASLLLWANTNAFINASAEL